MQNKLTPRQSRAWRLCALSVPAAMVLAGRGWLWVLAGSAAAGYGFEYVASTLDRIRAAALGQNDAQLQMPIMTPISPETWGVKESVMPEAEMPEGGDAENRGIDMEVATAAACLACGSDAVILRHPASITAIGKMIDALV